MRSRVRDTVDRDAGKVAAASVAVANIPAGTRLALGTGSTMEAALPMLARIPGLLVTPTSDVIAGRALSSGLNLIPLQAEYDIYLDGADQVAPNGDIVKGSWGAHVREKTLAALSGRRIIICDEGKLVDELIGPVPVAAIPFFASLHAPLSASSPATDDNGLVILKIGDGELIGPADQWDSGMLRRPGIVSTGLFPSQFVDQIVVGRADGSHHFLKT